MFSLIVSFLILLVEWHKIQCLVDDVTLRKIK